MSILDELRQEQQRLSERLTKIDLDRAKLAEQIAELGAAERVLSRLTHPRNRGGRRSAAPQAAAPAEPTRKVRKRRTAGPKVAALSLGEATLRAVEANGHGTSAEAVRQYLTDHLGMQVQANHLGMALQRHRRAGRLDQRDSLWYPHVETGSELA